MGGNGGLQLCTGRIGFLTQCFCNMSTTTASQLTFDGKWLHRNNVKVLSQPFITKKIAHF